MPVFNGLKTLDRAIGSVVRQTFPGWELLAVDDCSTDGTWDALNRWAEGDLRVGPLRTPENGGPGAARNIGLEHARGERIAYLDCDDEYYADYLQAVARLHQLADVLVFGYDVVYRDGEPDCRVEGWDPVPERGKLFRVNIVTPLGVSHRREWVQRIGGFDERLWRETDWDYWKRLARARARFKYMPQKSGRYHVRRASHSRRGRGLRNTLPAPSSEQRPAPSDGVCSIHEALGFRRRTTPLGDAGGDTGALRGGRSWHGRCAHRKGRRSGAAAARLRRSVLVIDEANCHGNRKMVTQIFAELGRWFPLEEFRVYPCHRGGDFVSNQAIAAPLCFATCDDVIDLT